MFHGHYDYFQKSLLGSRPNTKPEDRGILNAHNHWFILFYHVWQLAWIEIHWSSIWLRAPVTYDFTLHSRVRDHTTWSRRCLETAFEHFLLGSHNFMVTAFGLCVKWLLLEHWILIPLGALTLMGFGWRTFWPKSVHLEQPYTVYVGGKVGWLKRPLGPSITRTPKVCRPKVVAVQFPAIPDRNHRRCKSNKNKMIFRQFAADVIEGMFLLKLVGWVPPLIECLE